jgi:polar amino acid transport system substrate-binding protein
VGKRWSVPVLAVAMVCVFALFGCGSDEAITQIGQLDGKQFAVPSGTAADQLVLSKFPKAKFTYFDTALDCSLAVKDGKVDAAAYDEPILRNIAAKSEGLVVLPEMITVDDYGFAVALDNQELKTAIDEVVKELKASGTYAQMVERWLPSSCKARTAFSG